MNRPNTCHHHWTVVFLLGTVATIGSACNGSGGSPTSPPPPTAASASASFRLAGADHDEVVSYTSRSNLVFCRKAAGWADLWVRLAEQPTGDGGGGPYIDIDLCNVDQSGTFAAMDPSAAACGTDPTFDIWWHHGPGEIFSNGLGSQGCTLSLARNGSRLSGTFSCRGLAEVGGNRTLDVLDGSFECTEQ